LGARGRLDNEAAIAFLDHHDFRLLNRSWDGTFEPAAVVERLSEPQTEARLSLDEAAEFFERLYQEIHHWSPPTPWSIDQARQFFCGEALVRQSLIGVREKGSLVAAAALTRSAGSDAAKELCLVWAGSLERREEPARTVLSGCVRFALEAAKRIRFEVDESNVGLWTALNELGVLGEATLGIFAQNTAHADSHPSPKSDGLTFPPARALVVRSARFGQRLALDRTASTKQVGAGRENDAEADLRPDTAGGRHRDPNRCEHL
jgi:hypothetical protein